MASPEGINTREHSNTGSIEHQSSGSGNYEVQGSSTTSSQDKKAADATLNRLYTNAKKEPTTLSAPPAVGHAPHDHPKGLGYIPVFGPVYGILKVFLSDIFNGIKGLKQMAGGGGGGHGGGGHAKKDDHGHGGGGHGGGHH